MHIIESFKACLDSGELITVHKIQGSRRRKSDDRSTNEQYVTDTGATVHRMFSGEFAVMGSFGNPIWARRVD
jgi:hypothetical protein